MSADRSGLGGDGPPYDEALLREEPYGARPAGMRPAGMRPAGMRPAGMRPAGMRPAGMRPAGMRPAGMRPAGMRPAGMRPYDLPYGGLDPEEWSADVAELFCACSAVVRLGARLVFDVGELPVPPPLDGVAQYLPPPGQANPAPDQAQGSAPALSRVAADARAALFRLRLEPKDHALTLQLTIRNQLMRALVEDPEVAWALKQDIAHALALRADQGFLRGSGGLEPCGISETDGVLSHDDEVAGLEGVRDVVRRLRGGEQNARFANPGWVLGPGALDVLTKSSIRMHDDRTSLDSTRLLTLDGHDGGVLLGYPFVISAAAGERIYFSADWSEAWIGADRALVTVDVSTGTGFSTDETVVRAVMHHDFVIRRPAAFVHAVGPG